MMFFGERICILMNDLNENFSETKILELLGRNESKRK